VKPYIRATANPKPGWLAKFIRWWLDDEGRFPDPEKSGKLRYMYRFNETIHWGDSPEELEPLVVITDEMVELGMTARDVIKSVTFIPAKVYDNKILLKANPEYLGGLMALPLIERKRKLDGDWLIAEDQGTIFNRNWFEVVDAVPPHGVDCRGIDFAATEKELGKKIAGKHDPDYTALVWIRYMSGVFYILDVQEFRKAPAETDTLVLNICSQDKGSVPDNHDYRVRWEQEGGASGKRDSHHLIKMFAGYDCKGVPAAGRGDKFQRAKPLAAQAEAGNVKLLKGDWNDDFLEHLHNQPNMPHDDKMDAAAIAFHGCLEKSIKEKGKVTVTRRF
jgi:predicted phage terminase large subunit-like protein